VIFEHLLELSEGKLNLTQGNEELISTTDLLRTQTNINKILPVGQPKIQSNKNVKTGKKSKTHKNK
jgi:hypothetical protein